MEIKKIIVTDVTILEYTCWNTLKQTADCSFLMTVYLQ